MTLWQKPSRCTVNGCPEVAMIGGRVVLRDSQRPEGTVWLAPADWSVLVWAVKAGEYDHLTEETP